MAPPPPAEPLALTRFAGRIADRNDRAMAGSAVLTGVLAQRLGTGPRTIGTPRPALSAGWHAELAGAAEELRTLRDHLDALLQGGRTPVTASSRCAASVATVPPVAARRPDAAVVWFDAHADLNTPAESATGFLGGMALAAPLGRWDSGLGAGLAAGSTLLAGARDIDPAEQRRIDSGALTAVPPGPDLPERLRAAAAGRPVYVHIDCDVLDAPAAPGGLSADELSAALAALADGGFAGIEIAEFEAAGDPAATYAAAERLVAACEPVWTALSPRG
ncbi:arginase family protein [Nocardiopsis coralliicola]